MVRNEYGQKLNMIRTHLVELLDNVEYMISLLFKSLESEIDIGDATSFDKNVRAKTKELLDLCTEVVTLQQPMATDIRLILSSIRIKNDIERSVRDSLHIMELSDTVVASGDEFRKSLEATKSVLVEMISILKQSLIDGNSERLLKLNNLDEEIDLFYAKMNEVAREEIKSHPEAILEKVDFLLVIRMIERIADHFCNIAEKIYYIQTAEIIRIA